MELELQLELGRGLVQVETGLLRLGLGLEHWWMNSASNHIPSSRDDGCDLGWWYGSDVPHGYSKLYLTHRNTTDQVPAVHSYYRAFDGRIEACWGIMSTRGDLVGRVIQTFSFCIDCTITVPSPVAYSMVDELSLGVSYPDPTPWDGLAGSDPTWIKRMV
jgi:hypothetical protein